MRIASNRTSAGCSVPNPATLAGRVEPSVHGPSGMPIPGGLATRPNTCGIPRLFARITACVPTVESEITRSYGGLALHTCAAIWFSVPMSPSALKRSNLVPLARE